MERGKQLTSNGSIATESSRRDSMDYLKKGKNWAVGDSCRAYCRPECKVLEAKIMYISVENNCLISFLGYGYGAIVCMKYLHPSEGKLAQENQIMNATNDKMVQQQIAKDDGSTKSNKKLPKDQQDKSKKWVAGDSCRAIYYADGKLYEAKIVEPYSDGTCRVCFVGYGNKQDTSLKDLHPSKGKLAQENQINAVTNDEIFNEDDAWSTLNNRCSEECDVIGNQVPHAHSPPAARSAMSETESCEYIPSDSRRSHIHHHHSSSRKFHPPAPIMSHRQTSLMNQRDGYEGNEALSALLMSWYMAGYHTGLRKGCGQSRSYHSCGCSHYC